MFEKLSATVSAIAILTALWFSFNNWPEYTVAYLITCTVLYLLYPIKNDTTFDWYDAFIVRVVVFLTAPFWFLVALR